MTTQPDRQTHDTKGRPGNPPGHPVPELRICTINGHRRAYRIAGTGPVVLLIHGIGDNSTTWTSVQTRLAERFTVIAPDLLGHGQSGKPSGADYSVAAYANRMRDLLRVLGIDRVTVIGHSLGGGVAMQFAYQFPQLVERLVLVGTGGVTKDINFFLRFTSVPLGGEALALLRLPMVLPALQLAGRAAGLVFGSSRVGHDLPDMLRVLAALHEPSALLAFTRTLRAVVDWHGQVISMLNRCYLAESVPVQIIWGKHDAVVPVSHAWVAHDAMPGSWLEVFDDSGHFPFHDDPDRFVDLVENFIDSTEPAEYDETALRELLRIGNCEHAISERAAPQPDRAAFSPGEWGSIRPFAAAWR